MTNAFTNLTSNFAAAVLFAVLGIVLFGIGFWVFEKMTPGTLWREILQEHNTALAVLMGCVAIALAIIIAAAIL